MKVRALIWRRVLKVLMFAAVAFVVFGAILGAVAVTLARRKA